MGKELFRKSDLKRAGTLQDIIIGMSDGLIVPFALSAGLSGAVSSTGIVVIAGLVQIGAGSVAMGLGGYHAGKPGHDHHHGDELNSENPKATPEKNKETTDTKEFFANLGLSEELQQMAAEEVARDKDQWASIMMKNDSGINQPNTESAARSGINIGAAYVVGGLVTLSPYFFSDTPMDALKLSAPLTLVCLFVFGFLKSRLAGSNPWTGALRLAIAGALAAAAAFGVARIFAANN